MHALNANRQAMEIRALAMAVGLAAQGAAGKESRQAACLGTALPAVEIEDGSVAERHVVTERHASKLRCREPRSHEMGREFD